MKRSATMSSLSEVLR